MPMSKRRKRLPEPCESITVGSLVHDGRCVARRDGKAVFIDGGLPGEDVGFEYLATHRKYDEGRVTGIRRPSPARVEPKCAHFGVCGGCSLQHMAADAQLGAKQAILLDNLEHIGRVAPQSVLAPLTGPVWGYRNRARLGVRYVTGKGRVLVGFREKRASYIAELHRCEVLHPSVGRSLDALGRLVGELDARTRIPQIEVAVADTATALVFRHLDPLSEADRHRLRHFAEAHGFHVYLQPAGPDSLQLLWPGRSRLSYALPAHDVVIEFGPTDFIQINPAINRRIVDRVLDLLAVEAADRVLELYCGLGNFTLPLARRAAAVTGIEGDPALVSRARDNAVLNRIDNITLHVADLTGDNRDARWAGGAYDKVLLDPPRAGAPAALDLLGNIR
ncbi:MAG: methyltransferase domain-containing protein, partial [Gammaproteobacteria bacterium]